MKVKHINLIWAVVLILAGVGLLAQNLGVLGEVPGSVWGFVFAGLSILFFISYALNGVRAWGWLFPALVCAALSITIFWGEAGGGSSMMGLPILASVAIPFWVAFIVDRKKNAWAWIPGYIIGIIAVITAFADIVPGEFIGALVLCSIALPFYILFVVDRTSRGWALIPALILSVIGVIPPLTLVANDELIGAFVMFLFALPFFIVYVLVKSAWWAIIPAGVCASIGAIVLFVEGTHFDEERAGLMNGVLFLALAATFGIAWLRRKTQPTDWAKWPALGLAAVGVASMVWSSGLQTWWPIHSPGRRHRPPGHGTAPQAHALGRAPGRTALRPSPSATRKRGSKR